jgi:hypothetical protein
METRFEDGLVDQSMTTSAVYHAIMQSVENTYGDYGFGCVKMTFKGIKITDKKLPFLSERERGVSKNNIWYTHVTKLA